MLTAVKLMKTISFNSKANKGKFYRRIREYISQLIVLYVFCDYKKRFQLYLTTHREVHE